MSDLSLVLLGAGESSRFGLKVKKQWLRVGKKPLWLYVTNRFDSFYHFKKVLIVAHKDEIRFMQKLSDHTFVEGGKSRTQSLLNALKEVDTPYVLVSDIARACIKKEMVEKIIDSIGEADCAAPYIKVHDTVVYKNETVNRDEVKLIQTPQLSKTDTLTKALKSFPESTDESGAILKAGGRVVYIKGSPDYHKLTTAEDINKLSCLEPPAKITMCGSGFDVHPYQSDSKMFLGGVKVSEEYGLAGHSDADAAIHAIIDALLGAAGLGDIGELFPDSDDSYKGADSAVLLAKTKRLLDSLGFVINNVDLTIIAQKPKISPFKNQIRKRLCEILELDRSFINIKATTAEKMGFIGREEGLAAMATASLEFFDWTKEAGSVS